MPTSKPRVYVVQPVPAEALAELRRIAAVEVVPHFDRAISRDELLAGVRGCEYLWALGEIPVDGEVMDAGPLRFIAIMEILSRAVDVHAATQRAIPVSSLANLDIITTSTAEHVMALTLALARRLAAAERLVRDRGWAQYQSMALLGTLLDGKELGIVGLGNVGRKLARRARRMGMRVTYTDRSRFDERIERRLAVQWRELDDLLRAADVVALTPTLTASSVGLIDGRRLAMMKPTAYLVNTSRGQVVDEAALVAALAAERIAGAALDVFETEPPTPGGGPRDELLGMQNVLLTPHLGTATREARSAMAASVVADLGAAIAGGRPNTVINPEVYGRPPRAPADRIG
jgi:glyoxylate reductase